MGCVDRLEVCIQIRRQVRARGKAAACRSRRPCRNGGHPGNQEKENCAVGSAQRGNIPDQVTDCPIISDFTLIERGETADRSKIPVALRKRNGKSCKYRRILCSRRLHALHRNKDNELKPAVSRPPLQVYFMEDLQENRKESLE
jgi:hypothetical protein